MMEISINQTIFSHDKRIIGVKNQNDCQFLNLTLICVILRLVCTSVRVWENFREKINHGVQCWHDTKIHFSPQLCNSQYFNLVGKMIIYDVSISTPALKT